MQPPFCSGESGGRVRSPRRENLKNVTPPFPCGSYSQKRLQPPAFLAVENQQVHARGVLGILRPLQKPGIDERIDRFCDLLHVVSHKRGELFVCQECARVSVQKQQQVEIAGTCYDRRANEQPLDVLRWIVGRTPAHNVSFMQEHAWRMGFPGLKVLSAMSWTLIGAAPFDSAFHLHYTLSKAQPLFIIPIIPKKAVSQASSAGGLVLPATFSSVSFVNLAPIRGIPSQPRIARSDLTWTGLDLFNPLPDGCPSSEIPRRPSGFRLLGVASDDSKETNDLRRQAITEMAEAGASDATAPNNE